MSGKGGVGKSSITTQLALSLSLAGHSVGILDVDLTGPSIPRLFGLETAKITQAPGGWLPVQVHPSQFLPPVPDAASDPGDDEGLGLPSELIAEKSPDETTTSNGFAKTAPPGDNDARKIGPLHLMSLGFLLPSRSSAVVWRGPKKTAMVRQFLTDVLWPPNLDYLLIDTPPGTSDEHISLAETLLKVASPAPAIMGQAGKTNGTTQPHLAGAVIITTPQAVATSDVRKELNFCTKVGIRVLGVVENMSGYVCECCGVSTNLFGKGGGKLMSQDFEVKFLGSVPVDRQWGVLVEEGRRPVYGSVVKNGVVERDGSEDESDDETDEEENEAAEPQTNLRDAGLLVDKYRSCSLFGIFDLITKDLMDIVEADR